MKIMMIGILAVVVFAGSGTDASARERSSSGSYKGRATSGTFERNVARNKGNVYTTTTWQNQRGQGTHQAERKWNKEAGQGTYSSSTKWANGKTTSRAGTVKKNSDGSYTQQGTITGPEGKTAAVNRHVVGNKEKGHTVQTTFTGEDGKVLNVNKTVTNEDGVRQVKGSYSSNTGKSGTFESQSRVSDGKIVTDRSLKNQDGKTWSQEAVLDREGNTITRDVKNTNPSGESKSFQQSVTVNGVVTGK